RPWHRSRPPACEETGSPSVETTPALLAPSFLRKASTGYLEGLEFSEILSSLSLLIAYDVIFIAVAFMVFDSVVEE
ncbi:MAG TPA: hypothetical protein VLA72_12450, partial [Anaerolineales bacterium]|nr:hypothetical protein [Anaerolineales bacterium]